MNPESALLASKAAQYPQLIRRADPPALSSHALAAKNLRLILKERFPGVKFRITSEAFSMGTALRVSWEGWQNAPSHAEVDALTEEFCYSTFDGQSDSSESKQDPRGRAFRSLFGSVKHTSARRESISEEMMAKKLNTSLPSAPVKSCPRI